MTTTTWTKAERAHPRSRGENESSGYFLGALSGSSPLTRGKPPSSIRSENILGLIPAHAGKTGTPSAGSCGRWAHPRSRGENLSTYQACVGRAGSSPLTRGKRPPRSPRGGVCGLIPAHAGKTCRLTLWPPARRAHPRSRGENGLLYCRPVASMGSSPLTRGKLFTTAIMRPLLGLIPAHAGKTTAPADRKHRA